MLSINYEISIECLHAHISACTCCQIIIAFILCLTFNINVKQNEVKGILPECTIFWQSFKVLFTRKLIFVTHGKKLYNNFLFKCSHLSTDDNNY